MLYALQKRVLLTWDRMYQSFILARVWRTTFDKICSLQNTERAIPENIYIHIWKKHTHQQTPCRNDKLYYLF